MKYETKKLDYKKLNGISAETLKNHHDKLYQGYIDKSNEIKDKLEEIIQSKDKLEGNTTYSEIRSLKNGESFANDGVYLHENYFGIMGGDGKPSGELVEALSEKYGSFERFKEFFSACAMSARGWTILAWDSNVGELRVFNGDAHNHGGIWGAIPIMACDVYEHSYFIDYGADRKSYIEVFFDNLDWKKIDEIYIKVKDWAI